MLCLFNTPINTLKKREDKKFVESIFFILHCIQQMTIIHCVLI